MGPEVSAPLAQTWNVFLIAGQLNPIRLTTICFWIFYLKKMAVGKIIQTTI